MSKSRKENFIEKNSELSDKEINVQLLYWQEVHYLKLESIRSNLSKIVWIVVVGIILSIISIAINT